MPNLYCLGCEKKAAGSCPCCKDTHYCGQECQKFDWELNHRYETYLFKATSDPVEIHSPHEKQTRVELGKIRGQNEKLREEYRIIKERVQDALRGRKRSKRERALTHEQRKTYAFHLFSSMAAISGENDPRKENVDFLANLHTLAENMNQVPLADGGKREVLIGMRERAELVNLFRMKDILREREKLIMILKTREASQEAIAYKHQIQDVERKFVFRLFFREGDAINYDDIIENDRENRAEHLAQSWVDKVYRQSIGEASESLVEFIREVQNDPGVRERHPVRLTHAEKEEEADYLLKKLMLFKESALGVSYTLLDYKLKNGNISEEVAASSREHYRRVSEKVDSLFTQENERITEDLERMMRGIIGKDEWSKVRHLIEDVDFSQAVPSFGEGGLGGKLWNDIVGTSTRRKYFWNIFMFFACYVMIHFISYFMGFTNYKYSKDEEIYHLNTIEKSTNSTYYEQVENHQKNKEATNLLKSNLTQIVNMIDTMSMRDFYQFAEDYVTGKNLTERQQFLLDGVIDKEIAYLETNLTRNNLDMSKNYTENLTDISMRLFLEKLHTYNMADPLNEKQVKIDALSQISEHFQYFEQAISATGRSVGDIFIKDYVGRLHDLVNLVDLSNNQTDLFLDVYHNNSISFREQMVSLEGKNNAIGKGAPFYDYYFTDWNASSKIVTPWITGGITQTFNVIPEMFRGMKENFAITNAAAFASFNEIPHDYEMTWANTFCHFFVTAGNPGSYLATYYLICSFFLSWYRGLRSWGVGKMVNLTELILSKCSKNYETDDTILTAESQIRISKLLEDIYVTGDAQQASDTISDLWMNGKLSLEDVVTLKWKTELKDLRKKSSALVKFKKFTFLLDEFYSRGVERYFALLSLTVFYQYTQENWNMLQTYVSSIWTIITTVFKLIGLLFDTLYDITGFIPTGYWMGVFVGGAALLGYIGWLVYYYTTQFGPRLLRHRGYIKPTPDTNPTPKTNTTPKPDDFSYSEFFSSDQRFVARGVWNNSNNFLFTLLPTIWKYHMPLKTLSYILVMGINLSYYLPSSENFTKLRKDFVFSWGGLTKNLEERATFFEKFQKKVEEADKSSNAIKGVVTTYGELVKNNTITVTDAFFQNYSILSEGIRKGFTDYLEKNPNSVHQT